MWSMWAIQSSRLDHKGMHSWQLHWKLNPTGWWQLLLGTILQCPHRCNPCLIWDLRWVWQILRNSLKCLKHLSIKSFSCRFTSGICDYSNSDYYWWKGVYYLGTNEGEIERSDAEKGHWLWGTRPWLWLWRRGDGRHLTRKRTNYYNQRWAYRSSSSGNIIKHLHNRYHFCYRLSYGSFCSHIPI